ncbi:hypothetical protein [Erwinia amylovora]
MSNGGAWNGSELAVSYTHLDVYKRQGQPLSLMRYRQICRAEKQAYGLGASGIRRHLPNICLLYTSRCV